MARHRTRTPFPASTITVMTVLLVGAVLAITPGATAQPVGLIPDHVLYWNDQLREAFRQTGGPPTTLTRAGAIMHVAIYQAVHELSPTAAPYLASPAAPASTGPLEPAIDRAAYNTLTALFPAQNFLPAYLAARGVGVPLATSGDEVGARAAQEILTLRSDDGAGNPTVYAADYRPGHWRPTGSGEGASPNWGHTRPWTMLAVDQFRPPDPLGYTDGDALLRSKAYADQVNEVRSLGRFDSTTRTPDQTQIAQFWAEDLDGVQKPPGQLYAFTSIIARNHQLSQVDSARLFALVSMGLADAAVVAWQRKYLTPLALWRPESAIHEAGQVSNPDIAPDPSWQPLSADYTGRHFTPPFPSYTSGHSTLAGAWSVIMAGFFHTDADTFMGTTDDPHAAGVTRVYHSYSQAGFEDAISRMYNGVHYRMDCVEGYNSGRQLGEWVVTRYLLPGK